MQNAESGKAPENLPAAFDSAFIILHSAFPMSWEANRWTAKTPSELYHTLGPHGVDELIRNALADVWRTLPEEGRSIEAAITAAREVADCNTGVWRKIKQASPAAFFEGLRPTNADGHFRQAMVLCWMMMPRSGGRKVSDALKIVSQIFERNLAAWREDNATFTGVKAKPPRKAVAKKAPNKTPKGKSKAQAKRAKVKKK
jgi:hypothetical protein